MKICSRFESMETLQGAYLVHTNCADIKIYFVTDEIVRVRASFDKELAEESYILSTTAWEDRMDGLLEGERTRVAGVVPAVTEEDNMITFATSELTLTLQKNPIGFKLYDKEGSLLYSDLEGNPFVLDSNNRVVHYNRMLEDDCFYGFGEKTGDLNKNNCFMRERATDAMGFNPEKADSLLKENKENAIARFEYYKSLQKEDV